MRPRVYCGPALAALALAVFVPSAAPAQESLKLGMFDAQRLSEETKEGKKVQADLTSFRDKKTAELQAKEKEVIDLRGQLSSQALSLSAEKRSTLEKDIQRKTLELEQARESASREFQIELNEAQGRFQTKLVVVVEAFARAEGFDLIFERSQVAFAAPGVDVTTALVDAFNRAQAPQAAPTGAPAPDKK